MRLIDTHAHIYLPEFDIDREKTIQAATEVCIDSIVMPAIDSSTHEKMLQVENENPNCISMMGLHPCSVKADYHTEINIVENYLQQRAFIAIGEIGLDFHWDQTFIQQQYDAFHKQIQMAVHYDLPIVIHSRNAVDECIAVVSEYSSQIRGVFHCFSGTLLQAQKIIDLDFLLGIGGVVTFKNAGLDSVIREYGSLENIILETDAPYLAPVPYRGKRNESSYLKLIAEKIAELTNCPVEEVARVTTQNAENLFRLSNKH